MGMEKEEMKKVMSETRSLLSTFLPFLLTTALPECIKNVTQFSETFSHFKKEENVPFLAAAETIPFFFFVITKRSHNCYT